MDNDYVEGKVLLEKHRAVENLIQYTLSGSINWEKKGDKFVAKYRSTLNNTVEFEYCNSCENMCKIVVSNENGRIIISNRDISCELLYRFKNCVLGQVKEANVLVDFLM